MDNFVYTSDPNSWTTRRRYPRYLLDTLVVITETRDGRTHTVKGYTRDVCEGGLGGILANPLGNGDIVLLEFPLPAARQDLVVRARVHRHAGSHYGFEFVQTSPAVLQDIRRACERLPYCGSVRSGSA